MIVLAPNNSAASCISKEMQDQAISCINSMVKVASVAYSNYNFPAIRTLDFNLRGRTAGSARIVSRSISLNAVLFSENIASFITQTIPHEVAHILAVDIYGRAGDGHSIGWKKMMRALGAEPERCHNYDTSNSAVRTKSKFRYECACGREYIVSSVIHNRVQSKKAAYFCVVCDTNLDSMNVNFLGKVTYDTIMKDKV